jgi:1-acyl-sn-glycerol-3-phosphate acyltransferase
MKKRVIRYSDEATDDFAGTHIRTKPLRPGYVYLHSGAVWSFVSFFLYRIVAQPLIFLFVKLTFLQRFENRGVLKSAKSSGAFIYANHTNALLDAFVPNLVDWRRRGYIIVGPDAMSIPGLNGLLTMLGAVPLGSALKQKCDMLRCVDTRIRQKSLVAIYPEAHIWPFFTGIRPYSDASFSYPVRTGAPVYAMTNCYQKRRFGNFPKVTTWLDGPFFPDTGLSPVERRKKLREQCLSSMKARAAQESTYSYVLYIRR